MKTQISGDTGLREAHGEVGEFHNPWQPFNKGPLDMLRWALSRNAYDKSKPPQVPRIINDGASLQENRYPPEITWIGHASFAIHDGDQVVLTDPHFGKRALIPSRVRPPGVPIQSIPADAFAVLSHNHYDHLDSFTVDTLPESIHWFVPLGLADWFRKRGRHHVSELDWWQSQSHQGWTITCLPSQHWSRRINQGTNATLWCAWLLESEKHRYFFAGDTGYFHGFSEFGRSFEDIDVAMLPIGAYEPRWFMRYQHMNPAEAYQAFLDLDAHYMLPMHWGTFDLTDEPVDLAPHILEQEIQRAGGDTRVKTMAVGERWRLPLNTSESQ